MELDDNSVRQEQSLQIIPEMGCLKIVTGPKKPMTNCNINNDLGMPSKKKKSKLWDIVPKFAEPLPP